MMEFGQLGRGTKQVVFPSDAYCQLKALRKCATKSKRSSVEVAPAFGLWQLRTAPLVTKICPMSIFPVRKTCSRPFVAFQIVRSCLLQMVEAIGLEKYNLVLCNLAPPDMVGHTGIYPAAVKAVEATGTRSSVFPFCYISLPVSVLVQ